MSRLLASVHCRFDILINIGSKLYPIHLLKSTAVMVPTPFQIGGRSLSSTGNGTCVAEIVSPHPSSQLLLIGSTVRVANHSGFDFEIAFLDKDNKMIRMDKPFDVWRAPTELLSPRFTQMALNRVTGLEEGNTSEGLTSIFDTRNEIDPVSGDEAWEWDISRDLVPKPRKIPTSQLKFDRFESAFPYLQQVDPSISAIMDSLDWSYTTHLPSFHFMAVPPQVWQRPNQVRVIFRPLGFLVADILYQYPEMMEVQNIESRKRLIEQICKFPELSGQGWSTSLNSYDDFTPVHEKSKEAYMLPEVGVYRLRTCQWEKSTAATFSDKSGNNTSIKKSPISTKNGEKLFFEVLFAKRYSRSENSHIPTHT